MPEAKVIDGKSIANDIHTSLRGQIKEFTFQHRPPRLAVVLVGDDFASHVYVRRKRKACQQVGIASVDVNLPQDVPQKILTAHIEKLNTDQTIDGILIQLPLPPHLSATEIIKLVKPEKDVDGLHPLNRGLLGSSEVFHIPCTPLGVMELLRRAKCEIAGKVAAVVGRSVLVGLPLSRLLLQANATVINMHSKTANPQRLAKKADILVAAVGIPHLITTDWVKQDATVIDVGINRLNSGLVGDVNYDEVKKIAGKLTPVPGGVGPMTIAMLLQNTFNAARGEG